MQENEELNIKTERRTLGVHLTSSDLFLKHIYPEIKNKLYNFVWVDLFAGEGNLVFPILEKIDNQERIEFFKNHIFLSDIQEEMVQTCIKKAQSYNIPVDLAKKNIILRDNLQSYPKFLKKKELPIFHITNPPYLYLGYIRKHPETQNHLSYFGKENEGYQDLYQIAMINDLRNEIKNFIYIIPTNFLFGSSVSNKFRLDFLKFYDIRKMYIFETQIFEFTGTNILIGFFERKRNPSLSVTEFEGLKFKKNDEKIKRKYRLLPKYNYRAGSEFEEFLEKYRCHRPLKVDYYLQKKEVDKNSGNQHIQVIDTNQYKSKKYKKGVLEVNRELKKKVKGNILYVKTVDTGSLEGRVGLYNIKKDFGVDGIYVSGNTYRTTPIQIFLEPKISVNSQNLLRKYFNLILEYYRKELDSEFLTTYKYSNADYTRKYLGLRQVRKLIKTFPVLEINEKKLEDLIENVDKKNVKEIIRLIDNCSVRKN